MKSSGIVEKGQIILFGSGEYSDYCVMMLAAATSDFSLESELEKFLEANPRQRNDYCFDAYEFLSHLHVSGLIEDLSYREVHLGSYSCVPTKGWADY